MYYNGQSGRPYSYVYETDLNRDGGAFNDLLYTRARTKSRS